MIYSTVVTFFEQKQTQLKKYGNDIHVYTCKINQLPVLCPSIPSDREHFRYISAPDASVCIHGTAK